MADYNVYHLGLIVVLLLVSVFLGYFLLQAHVVHTKLYSHLLNEKVITLSMEANETSNVVTAMLKVKEAQSYLELLIELTGGVKMLSNYCGVDILPFRYTLQEQLSYYQDVLKQSTPPN